MSAHFIFATGTGQFRLHLHKKKKKKKKKLAQKTVKTHKQLNPLVPNENYSYGTV